MEFKGTPGKWEVELTTVQTKRRLIANCIGNGITFSEEDKMNALLISKAPEMLELLQYFVKNHLLSVECHEMALKMIEEATELKSE